MFKKQYSMLFLCALVCASQPIKAEGMSTTNKVLSTVAVTALGVGSVATVVQWWNLGSRLDELQMCKKVGPLVERNVWLSPYDFTTGRALWGSFTRLGTRAQKDKYRQQLLEEICSAERIDRNAPDMHIQVSIAINNALINLQEELDNYANLTPIIATIAREVGFIKNPQELITSDYVIDHDLIAPVCFASRAPAYEYCPSPSERVLHSYMQSVSLPITVKYAWSPMLRTRIPYWFTWTHKKAAECAFEVLQQYARIRAIQRVMEQYLAPSNPSQSINLNVKRR